MAKKSKGQKKNAPARRKTATRAAGKKVAAKKAQFAPGAMKQIGILTLTKNDDTNGFFQLRKSLREDFGYVEGKDISLHFRFANGDNSKLSALAAELLAIPVELFVTGGTRALKEVSALNPNIKIIQAVGGEDPSSGGGAGASSQRTGFFLDVATMCTNQVNRLKNQKHKTDLTVLHDSTSQVKNDRNPFTAVVQAATGIDLNEIDVGNSDELQSKLTAGPVFKSSNTNVVAGFMVIPNGMFFDNCKFIAQKVDAAMQTRPNTWATYPEPEFKDEHSAATKNRVIVSGHKVAKAYKDTAAHIDDHLKGKPPKPSKEADKQEDP